MDDQQLHDELDALLKKTTQEFVEAKDIKKPFRVMVEVVAKDSRSRKEIFADDDYAPVHKTFLTDLMVHGMTMRALINACNEARFDFSHSMTNRNGEDPTAWDMVHLYNNLNHFMEEAMEYASKGVSHKYFTKRLFEKTRNKKDALAILNQLKAITGLYCDSDEERDNCVRDILEDHPDSEETNE